MYVHVNLFTCVCITFENTHTNVFIDLKTHTNVFTNQHGSLLKKSRMFRRSNQIKMFTWKGHWPITKYKQVLTHKGTLFHLVQSVLVIIKV